MPAKPVAGAANGLEVLGPELAAQVADVDVDDVGAGVEVEAPDAGEQLLAAESTWPGWRRNISSSENSRAVSSTSRVADRRRARARRSSRSAPASSTVGSGVPVARSRARMRASSSSKRNGLVT